MAIVAPPVPLRAALYCRVSTTDQEREGTSLETQEAACRRYAEEHGYSVSEAHVYRETFTGAEFHDRPRLSDVRAILRARDIDVVVAYAVDRLSRDQVHIWLLLDELDRAGARLEMVTEAFDDSPTGKFLLSARAFAAEVERQKIRERTGRGRLALVQAGKLYAPGTDRYGYRRVPGESRREVHEPEAIVVRDIFESYARGEPIRGIIRRLNQSGIPSPGAGKRVYQADSRFGSGPDGKTWWGSGAIHRILIDPVYKGETYAFRWTGHKNGGSLAVRIRPREEWIALPDNVTPAIISADLWEAVQVRLAMNKGESTRNQARPYLLRGLMVCGSCGRKLRSSPERDRRVYRCASRETPSGPCGAPRVPADDVERWVWDEVSAILRDPAIIAREVEQARKAGDDPGLTSALISAQRRLAKIERDQERLAAGFRNKTGRMLELLEREIGRAEVERQQTVKEIADLESRIAARQQVAKRWADVEAYCQRVDGRLETFDFNQKRLALEALAVKVTAVGRDWRLDGGVPTGEIEGIVSTNAAGCARRRRRSPARGGRAPGP